ncbi:7,8-didemethyl-8-hydroxy-5-deazariboflavin synthase CofG [Subtercola boreus]|uniref:7,8-didemethyl-8-hydroxy-5-deazariboflavin synthase n=1 Tax=Subtercola boreus TaxID=120213 RepID=A0A3E0WB64_9MICO|nr:7,8-didemethyl-8-hydroxy-5-deazariboflavin synthase CofG [Subtercola boreus]RFA20597.1 7,8-didemethyl-8-hydroxy-5-deazariboflavin synthase subunit CofG [Subtercola boreus]RFA20712.1 7,8-didemethyl-8-hydroxy-5-deazariboflavin synthase subunit CofG [Subtercola boreus]RFA26922.1 7,8-didemethyl-8-hydroxy-5-deazariboflavin synthase subunit CofG [Subtercola boreus]
MNTGDALTAVRSGVYPDPVTAEALLHARGAELDELLAVAGRLRDEGLERAGRPGVITYSRKVFIPLTHLCQDRCHYCVFVQSPGSLARAGIAPYLSTDDVLQIARQGAAMGCKEALFTLGDRPENRWPTARDWLDEHGYESTIDYVRDMAERVLVETGLLPHLNPGVMTPAELASLKRVAPSMGMMLETTATRLWSEKGEAHFGSPDKEPAVRLRVLDDAGRLKIPFTTGVLVGIGETPAERVDAMFAIRASAAEHGHVQETIVQNFRAKDSTAMRGAGDLATDEYVAAVAVTRLVLGADARLQAPPNLTDSAELELLIRAGIDDWGGVSPLTPDHVNPERPWPEIDELARLTAAGGYALRERLTTHPHYIREGAPWLDPAVLPFVRALADSAGLARDEGTPLQPARLQGTGAGSSAFGRVHVTVRSTVSMALERAERSPSALADADLTALLRATGAELDALATLADELRSSRFGATVSFVMNRNLDSSLVGDTDAGRGGGRAGGLTLADLGALASEAAALGATEICMQGLARPELGASAYRDLVRAVVDAQPTLHLHAFRPVELADGAARSGLALPEHLAALAEAGVGSVPGTGARILDDQVRQTMTGGRDIPVAEWLDIITAAHRAGLRSTATMIYGHIERADQIVAHLRTVVAVQEQTGGFTEFIPMPFVPAEHPAMPAHLTGRTPNLRRSRAVIAVSRLVLDDHIGHIQAAWTKLGPAGALTVLNGGADDLGGVLLDGSLNPAAGAESGRQLSADDVAGYARRLGRTAWQRSTLYRPIETR